MNKPLSSDDLDSLGFELSLSELSDLMGHDSCAACGKETNGPVLCAECASEGWTVDP